MSNERQKVGRTTDLFMIWEKREQKEVLGEWRGQLTLIYDPTHHASEPNSPPENHFSSKERKEAVTNLSNTTGHPNWHLRKITFTSSKT